MAKATRRVKPSHPTRPYVTHGGKRIELPLLKAPVGRKSPQVSQKYPALNNPADVAIVEYYLRLLAEIHYLNVPASERWLQQSTAVSGTGDLEPSAASAIQQLQSKMRVSDPEEVSAGIIKPDGETLKALVDYGDYAEKLEAMKCGPNPADYIYYGSFDAEKFVRLYKAKFSGNPHYTEAAEPSLRQFLGFMTADPFFIDLRWMAYVMATICWETTKRTAVSHTNAKGKTITLHPWLMSWAPVEEDGHGKGRRYEKPVKVQQVEGGHVRVTEWDGDQWLVKPDGAYSAISKRPTTGAAPTLETAAKVYSDDGGKELAYFGRGYVQLTWWFNYATAGTHIGKGIQMLLDPELALDPPTAYQLMSYCLRTGYGFANRHKLGDYMYGAITNYAGARAMVNGTDHAGDIANYAKQFEGILMESRS